MLVIIIAPVFVWALCIYLQKPFSRLYVLDNPSHRSMHDEPKPRTGGLAIFFVIFISWLMLLFTNNNEEHVYFLFSGMCLLAVISFLDDRYSVPQIFRLFAHIVAALLLILGGIGLTSNDIPIDFFVKIDLVLSVLSIVVVVWIINLYNFMDGMDGLAGGMGLIGFSCFGCLGWLGGNDLFMLMAFVVAAANLGFLIHNFPPANIFMGDVGSITLGYFVAYFSLWGIRTGLFLWWAPLLIFSPFIVDATITLIGRLLSGEKIWEAHKSHCYQRLVQSGWGHRKTAIFEYCLMVASASTVILLTIKNNIILTACILFLWMLLYILIMFLVNRINAYSGGAR